MGLSERVLQALIRERQNDTNTIGRRTVSRQMCGSGFGKERALWRGKLVFRKTVLASHLRYKNGIILAPNTVSENGFLLEKKTL